MQVFPKNDRIRNRSGSTFERSAIKFASFEGFEEIGRGRVEIRYECAAEPAGFSIR
jgi:hypothetical protein